jgi:ATP-binding cassette subfamily F protein 3
VIVSHDREFLDRLCTQIVETERGVSTTYLATILLIYNKKPKTKSAISAYERQQKELEKQQTFVDRFRASATRSTQAKAARNN